MEGINDVEVPQICCGRFISHVERMLEREVPDRKGFEFGIAALDSPQAVMIQLGQTGGQFAASRPGGCDDDQRFFGFDVFIGTKAFFTQYRIDIGRISMGWPMHIYFDIPEFQRVFEKSGCRLILVARYDDTCNIQIPCPQVVNQL